MIKFSDKITKIKGVGEKRAALFKKLSVFTVEELLCFAPRSYIDMSTALSISQVMEYIDKNVCVSGTVLFTPSKMPSKNPHAKIYKTDISDETGILSLLFFNNVYIDRLLKEGAQYIFYGKLTLDKFARPQMISPEFVKLSADFKIRPIYPQTAGLSSRAIEKTVAQALSEIVEIPDFLPEKIRVENGLLTLKEAVLNLHFPKCKEFSERARKRLAFDEIFILSTALSLLRTAGAEKTENVIKRDFTKDFEKKLPFILTFAQKRVIDECVADMKSGIQMSRLVQGDVGAGKTAVAAAVVYNAFKNGMQSVFAAPTEILAEQHFETFKEFFKDENIKIELLCGGTKKGEKERIKKECSEGTTALLIGTHAVMQSDVKFKRLGLCITDEQHRFGVEQRASLFKKGKNPNVLVMSATPIPRSLGLILFGELSVSVIDELPPGRKKIKTYAVSKSYRDRIYRWIRGFIEKGFSAYVITPLVDDAENESVLTPAVQFKEKLQRDYFQDIEVGLLHGRMPPEEKERVMSDFGEGKIRLLVSTTVIEVGVDVKSAVAMVIEDADRFGLSTLHQLRGRIGRNDEQCYCVLVSDSKSKTARERLEIMENTTDGFKIADKDLEMRGPGDFLGARQHGLPALDFSAAISDVKILETASGSAKKLLEEDGGLKKPEHSEIRRRALELIKNAQGTIS